MKKYLFLTLVLVVSACGGGSGHRNNVASISDAARLSNGKVTSMASEILVAQDGVSPSIVRSTTVTEGGKKYNVYRLDNAKFFDNEMDSEDEYISFGIDGKGQIDSIVYRYPEEDNTISIETINRESSDSSVFTENVYKYKVVISSGTYYTDSLVPGNYSKDQIKEAFRDAYEGEISEAMLDEIDEQIDANDMEPIEFVHRHVVDLKGKDMPESNKLRYADFGYTTILAKEVHQEGDGVGDDNTPIFGGYEIKEIKDTENLHDMTFSGKAIAALGEVHENGATKIETGDTNTTLRFDENGKETLTMPFNDYYTIKVEKPHDGEYAITWSGTTSIGFDLDSEQSVNNQRVNIKYYGDNGIPAEAVGGIRFQNNNVQFDGAFGVTKN